MHSPTFSFILFAFNQEQYIRQAVKSAFEQTYSPLEIILSDDGSKDRTFGIMREMASAYRGPHAIVINRNEPNLGIGPHVNKAFGMATGDWIITAAGDDISDTDRCTRVAEVIRSNPQAGAIGAGWRRIDSAGEPLPHTMLGRYRANRIDTAGDVSWIDHYKRGDFGLWGMSVAWRTEMLRKAPQLPAEVIQEDEVYSFFCALAGYDLIHNDLPLVSYREHDNNISGRTLAPDFVSRDRHRTSKAKMRLATMRFLADVLAKPNAPGKNLWSEEAWRNLTQAVSYRLEIEMEQAAWWDRGVTERIRRTFFPARCNGRLARPREMHLILPHGMLAALSRLFNF